MLVSARSSLDVPRSLSPAVSPLAPVRVDQIAGERAVPPPLVSSASLLDRLAVLCPPRAQKSREQLFHRLGLAPAPANPLALVMLSPALAQRAFARDLARLLRSRALLEASHARGQWPLVSHARWVAHRDQQIAPLLGVDPERPVVAPESAPLPAPAPTPLTDTAYRAEILAMTQRNHALVGAAARLRSRRLFKSAED